MDIKLESFKNFVKVCIYRIIIFNKTLKKYIEYFYKVFNLINSYSVLLSLKKSFINYLIIVLPVEKINVFGFTTIVNKLESILELDFPYILKDCKSYFGLIN